jgi:hypothetical protein
MTTGDANPGLAVIGRPSAGGRGGGAEASGDLIMAEFEESFSPPLEDLPKMGPPRWLLFRKVRRSNHVNRVVLTNLEGSFGEILDGDVSACNDGDDLPTTVFLSSPGALILDIDGESSSPCQFTIKQDPDKVGTGDLVIQVKDQQRKFDNVVVPETMLAESEQTPEVPDKSMPTASVAEPSQENVPPWTLNAGLIRQRPSLLVLNDGTFTGVNKDHVQVWFDSDALHVISARPQGTDSSRLAIRVRGRGPRDEEEVVPPRGTGDLIIQVRDVPKTFPDVEEENRGED